ncbi:thioredoxin family protein [Desulfospira joergensenii]|uniref:thioredoxin family protein n=1 Tax=Desulfospira joergensenii TaxID=53329 RepID=UPI0003B63CDA|nr:thioredoxin domain-containing protein [Desulfospira joergensenii]
MRMQILKKLNVPGILLLLLAAATVFAEDLSTLPVNGRVTLIDLGAKKCIPCKMMAPILVKLEKSYQGKADIVFIDVWENRDQVKKFKIRAIPTQIFFNEQGEEVFRHVGFMDEKSIIRQMTKMGVKEPAPDDKG